jgi:predicted nucleic acid-binding protein
VQSSEFSVEEKSAGGPQESQDPGAKTASGAPTAKRARKEEERTHPFIPQNRRDGAEERKSQRVGHPAESDRRAKFFEKRLRLLPDGLAVHEEWRKPLVTYSVSGVQVHDARLVAAMRVHGLKRILTFNDKDFARYTDIQAIHPRAIPRS